MVKKRENVFLHTNMKGLDTPVHPLLQANPYVIGGGRKRRPLEMNQPGKYVKLGEKRRETERVWHESREVERHLAAQGLLADANLAEDMYRMEVVEDAVEWWDAYYESGGDFVLDNEQNPVTSYVQHPVMDIERTAAAGKLYLTKKEMKRKRKNERLERFKLQQERIRKGLEPAPPPKVKLSNLMSVLTNEAIKDPTSVEKRVKQEVQQRYQKHMAENESRKLTKEQKHQKQHEQRAKDRESGVIRAVYTVPEIDLKQFFKVDKTAQQLELLGVCLVTEGKIMVVVEGGPKAIKFYDKLMMKRIQWPIEKLWEGPVEPRFKKWSVIKRDVDLAIQRFGIENYWRSTSSAQ